MRAFSGLWFYVVYFAGAALFLGVVFGQIHGLRNFYAPLVIPGAFALLCVVYGHFVDAKREPIKTFDYRRNKSVVLFRRSRFFYITIEHWGYVGAAIFALLLLVSAIHARRAFSIEHGSAKRIEPSPVATSTEAVRTRFLTAEPSRQ
jgi:hypothetical protein